jgi:hypothetical protein
MERREERKRDCAGRKNGGKEGERASEREALPNLKRGRRLLVRSVRSHGWKREIDR